MSNARPDRRFKRPLILFRLKIKFAGHARALRDKDRQTARTLLAGLAIEFPGNLLYAKELARIQ